MRIADWNRCFACLLAGTMFIAGISSAAAQEQPTPNDRDQSSQQQDGGLAVTGERDSLPEIVNGRFQMPPLVAPSINTDDVGNGRTPEGFRSEVDRPLRLLPEDGSEHSQFWIFAHWSAPNTYSYPLYFEDRMLERHGHERFGVLQPMASGVRFFATVPMLPYLTAISHPCDCQYTLGYFRPGSCAPKMYQRPPWDRRAVIAESAAVATGIIAVP